MSEKAVFSVTVPVAAIAGTVTQPLFHVPTGHGGITLTKAYILSSAAATSELTLVSGTGVGTISTAIGTLNATLVANIQQAITISTAYVASGSWVGIKTNAGGSLATTNFVILEYVFGK